MQAIILLEDWLTQYDNLAKVKQRQPVQPYVVYLPGVEQDYLPFDREKSCTEVKGQCISDKNGFKM